MSGVLADDMIQLMCARLERMGLEYVFFDQARFPSKFSFTYKTSGASVFGFLESPLRTVQLSEITGVYVRYTEFRRARKLPGFNAKESELVDFEHRLAFLRLLDALPCTVVNRPMASVSNDSKLYQQQLSRSLGFSTPRTLVTNLPSNATRFYFECNERVIYKSLSGVRSVVRFLTERDIKRLRALRNCPTQFQEFIEGVDVRVHTVGREVFATEVMSRATDYRYAVREGMPVTMRAAELPPGIAASCQRMARSLGLPVTGIDLRRTSQNRYYCFEVNTSPAFLFYERASGQPISEAVAKLLYHGDR